MQFYIGTLTKKGGEGILRIALENGKLTRLQTIGGITEPNWLLRSADGSRLYTVSADGSDGQGAVNCYDISDGAARLEARRDTGGVEPCHLLLSPDGRRMLVTNYMSGSLAVFAIGEDGSLGERLSLTAYEGSGPHPTRQTCAHLHQTVLLPDGRYVTADLGADLLRIFTLDDAGCPVITGEVKTQGGPRHILVADAATAYLDHELSSELSLLRISADGTVTTAQTLPALPADWSGANTAAAVRFSPDGRQVIVSNRGHGSLAVFDRAADGTLLPARWINGGAFPRDFLPLEDGTYLVADQNAGVWLLDADGNALDFHAAMGAVCICPV